MTKEPVIEPKVPSEPLEPVERLLAEYHQCNEGYNSRDYIAQDEFSKLIQSFSILLAILLGVNLFGQINPTLRLFIAGTLGLLGLFVFVSMLLDIEGACSCKVALRRRAQEIEEAIPGDVPEIWNIIDSRDRFFEEGPMKKRIKRVKKKGVIRPEIRETERETEGILFVNASRLVVILWILIVIAVMIWGGKIPAKALQ